MKNDTTVLAICLWLSLFAAAVVGLSVTGCAVSEQHDTSLLDPVARVLDDNQKAVLANWMAEHGNVRIATREDCDCEDDILYFQRVGPWSKPIPDYEPYVAAGDFNNDGQKDFAVVVVEARRVKRSDGVLVIFNGPVSKSSNPAFVGKAQLFPHQALFASQVEGYLLAGPFESEACILRPKLDGYVEDCGGFAENGGK